jgi:acyl carrier protein
MKKLIDLIANIINVPVGELTPQSGPANIPAWDSLAHIGIMSAVEQTYDLQLTMPEMLSIKTVADLRNAIEKRGVTLLDEEIQ